MFFSMEKWLDYWKKKGSMSELLNLTKLKKLKL